MSSYDTYKFIPFILIDGSRYFNKEYIEEHNVTHMIDINTNQKNNA